MVADDVLPFFHRALQQLSSADGVAKKEYNMFIVGEQIKKLLAKNGRERDAVAFGDLFRKLQHTVSSGC